LGLKDTIAGGDVPVAWTNTRYRMVYLSMGHGDKILTDQRQNRMFDEGPPPAAVAALESASPPE
jgi:type 1 glutamine amidotransferase